MTPKLLDPTGFIIDCTAIQYCSSNTGAASDKNNSTEARNATVTTTIKSSNESTPTANFSTPTTEEAKFHVPNTNGLLQRSLYVVSK